MSEEELNKIKNLIKNTTFLSSVEKQEWSSLLGVMNDKQLLDLENILQTTQAVVPQNSAPVQPIASKPIPAIVPKVVNSPVSATKPGLSFQNTNVVKQSQPPVPLQAESLKPKTVAQSSFLKNIEPVKPGAASVAMQKLPVQPIQPKAIVQPVKNEPGKINSKSPVSNLGADKNTGFAHIMNWPKVGKKSGQENIKSDLSKTGLKAVGVKTNTFSENLKNILAEKELPAPVVPLPKKSAVTNTENSLEKVVLNIPIQNQPQVQPKPVMVEKQDIHIENLNTDTLILGNTPTSQILSNALSRSASLGSTKIANLQSQSQSSGLRNNLPPVSIKKPLQISPLKPEQLKPQAKVTISELAKKLQAASASNPVAQAANSGLNFDQKTIENKQKLEKLAQLNKNIVKVDINSLAEVESFEVVNFKKNPDGIILGFKDLIRKIGFYPVIFSLEKSPAYKRYLQTGTEMIKDLKDSEAIAAWSTGPELLEKKDFETFADILRKIQAE